MKFTSRPVLTNICIQHTLYYTIHNNIYREYKFTLRTVLTTTYIQHTIQYTIHINIYRGHKFTSRLVLTNMYIQHCIQYTRIQYTICTQDINMLRNPCRLMQIYGIILYSTQYNIYTGYKLTSRPVLTNVFLQYPR